MSHNTITTSHNVPSLQDLEFFKTLLGEKYVLTNADDMAAYVVERRNIYNKTCPCVLKPKDTEQVSQIMQHCCSRNLAVVPQGGNTGLVGAQMPATGNEIIIALSRLTGDITVSKLTQSITCGVGNTLAQVQMAADEAELFFPLSLASEGSCQIGGNIASNAGGTGVVKYGNMRDLVLGLEVVMSDGQIWNGLKTLRKDNTGYDLKQLFIGSEGTLGIITQATLKLFAKPKQISTAFIAIQNPSHAVELLALAQKHTNSQVSTFEIIPQIGIDYVLKHGQNARLPVNTPAPWYVLLEVLADETNLTSLLEGAFDAALVVDATIAQNQTQAKEFWYLRHMLSQVQGLEGGSIKHDISVPVADIPDFLEKAAIIVQATIPNSRPVPFGHIGDGNLHYNISQPIDMDKQEFLNQWHKMADAVHALVLKMNGSISAEHGIGQMKVGAMAHIKSPIELKMMQQIKQQFDPKNILNPFKTVPL